MRSSEATRNVFNFNHISNEHPEEVLKSLKEFYRLYHEKWWCYNQAFKRYKKKSLSLSLLAAGSIISGAAAGWITLNPIVIGVLTSVGIIAKVISDFKKYDKKVEMTRYAATTYNKVLDQLRMYLRGGNTDYDHEKFIRAMRIIDDTIVDNCPEVESYWSKRYVKVFSSDETPSAGQQGLGWSPQKERHRRRSFG